MLPRGQKPSRRKHGEHAVTSRLPYEADAAVTTEQRMKIVGTESTDSSGSDNRRPMTAEEQRLQAVEAKALAFELILNALIGNADRRSMVLDVIERDVSDWNERPTPAAQSELAEAAREQVHRIIQGFRETTKPRPTH